MTPKTLAEIKRNYHTWPVTELVKEIERLKAQNAALLTDSSGRTWHVMEREDRSVSIYYTLADDPTHYIVFDSLAAGLDEGEER